MVQFEYGFKVLFDVGPLSGLFLTVPGKEECGV